MILTLIAKKRQSADGTRAWYNFSVKRGDAWYDVKFINECVAPQVYNIERDKNRNNKIMRAFIKVDERTSEVVNKGGRLTLFVSAFDELTTDELRNAVEVERNVVEAFREKRRADTMNFYRDDAPPPPVDEPRPDECRRKTSDIQPKEVDAEDIGL